MGVLTVVSLACLPAPAAMTAGDHQIATRAGTAQTCGQRELFGRTINIRARGERISCQRVMRIATEPKCRIRLGKPWSCFSFRTPDPILVWFKSKQLFKPRWSPLIVAKRPACEDSPFDAELWAGQQQGFPSARQVLADDIVRCDQLAGMTITEVEELLGEPSEAYTDRGREYRDYVLGDQRDSLFQLDPEFLYLKFGEDGVLMKSGYYTG